MALLGLTAEHRLPLRATRWRLCRRAVELVVDGAPDTAATLLAAASDAPTPTVSLPDPIRVLRASGTGDALDDAMWSWDERDGCDGVAARLGDELWLLADPRQATRIASWLSERGLAVGVGATTGLDEAERSAAAAGHALARAVDCGVVDWDRTVAEGAVGLIDPAAGAAFATALFDRLATAPSGRSVLLPTLESFLRHHGSRGAVAAEMAIHRNTVRNRLQEIESALDRSFDDPQFRMDAWIALQLDHRGSPAARDPFG